MKQGGTIDAEALVSRDVDKGTDLIVTARTFGGAVRFTVTETDVPYWEHINDVVLNSFGLIGPWAFVAEEHGAPDDVTEWLFVVDGNTAYLFHDGRGRNDGAYNSVYTNAIEVV